MSSLRNSLHRRNHKERGQLAHRSKLGILEKHKDYVLRAKDYHSKQDRIRRLKQKASEKNKDEFHFGMVNQRTNEGVHIQSRGNVAMPLDMVKLLKTQDENYVRTMRTRGQKVCSLFLFIFCCVLNNSPFQENRQDQSATHRACGLDFSWFIQRTRRG